jgi:uncharacterized membrane protein
MGRLPFIDFARGVVMIIMAWDHVSGFWHQLHHGGEGILGRMPAFASLTWFLERFVSHWCAPTFIFLSGTALALSTIRRLSRGASQVEVTLHLIKRGLVLLLFEALIVSPAFSLPWLYFGVIACIGVCLIIFSVCRRLPFTVILTLSLIIVLNHGFLSLDFIPNDTPLGWFVRVILHEPNFDWYPYFGLYPLIPWIGVMGLGWCFGMFLWESGGEKILKHKAPLIGAGFAAIALFFVVRWLNGYGNLLRRWGNTAIDWLYVSKYPPSIAFLLWALGGMCVFLAIGLYLQERPDYDKGVTGIVFAFGRNPLFFYLVHLWLFRMRLPGPYQPPFYLQMLQTFLFWLVGLVVLWQLCIRYERLKRTHPRFLQYI